jgi:uncharacterized protein DUF4129
MRGQVDEMISQAWRRILPLLVVGGLLAAAAVAASWSSVGVHRVPLPLESLTASPRPSPSESSASSQLSRTARGEHTLVVIPEWVKIAVLLILAAIVLAFVISVIVYAIRNSRENRTDISVHAVNVTVTRREAVLAAVDATIEELANDDGDPRSAVILCWVRLEEIAATAGTARAPGDSPTDLVTRLLRAHQVSRPVLGTLADLYRTARYSRQEIGSSMRDQARAALGRLRAELAVSSSGPLDADEAVTAGSPYPRPRPRVGGV